MRSRRRTETTIETRERWVITRHRAQSPTLCSECDGAQPMLTPEETQRLTGVHVRNIYQWVEAGRVHFIEKPNGSLLVCLAPLGMDIVLQRAAADTGDTSELPSGADIE